MEIVHAAGLDTDTIVAVATAPGRGGVGVIRLSGPQALQIAQTICGRDKPFEPRVATFCKFRNRAAEVLDSGLCLSFPAPGSFTGEDVAELQGHGSPVVLDRLVQTAIAAGARLARPGEFSERAYLNGKMDLAQAESIADLINAASTESARAAMRSLQGEFSILLNNLSSELLALRVQVEAAIDFPDEDIEILSAPGVNRSLVKMLSAVEQIVERTRTGVRLTEGARLVLIGAPNVGKSSVLNKLCGEERAIVTPVAGTTRDLVREQLLLRGIPVELVDTAGMRETEDTIEAEGVRRAQAAAVDADLVLAVYDVLAPETGAFIANWAESIDAFEPGSGPSEGRLDQPANLVIIANKIDQMEPAALDSYNHPDDLSKLALTNNVPIETVSAVSGEGIDRLTERLVKILMGERHASNAGSPSAGKSKFGDLNPADTFSARSRHLQALKRCYAGLVEARDGIAAGVGAELVAEHLRHAQGELSSVCGEITTDELLGEIFSGFCIGK